MSFYVPKKGMYESMGLVQLIQNYCKPCLKYETAWGKKLWSGVGGVERVEYCIFRAEYRSLSFKSMKNVCVISAILE